MKRAALLLLLVSVFAAVGVSQTSGNSMSPTADKTEKSKRPPVFRANKEQITQAQEKLRQAGFYSGEATGKLDEPTRAGLKKFQESNGLKATGTLNRATLEKMGIELTEKQREIPIPESSYASTTSKTSDAKSKRGPVFRATKDQISAAQDLLKSQGLYNGQSTGKLDDATRSALKKYQEGNGLKPTGTLNRTTLEKMGIALTEKQKQDAGSAKP